MLTISILTANCPQMETVTPKFVFLDEYFLQEIFLDRLTRQLHQPPSPHASKTLIVNVSHKYCRSFGLA